MNINHWNLFNKKHKAGLNNLTLACFTDNISITKPLGYQYKINWSKALKKASKSNDYKNKLTRICDKLAIKQVKNFLVHYNFRNNFFPYSVEHKKENFFLNASTLNRGHYALHTIDDKFIYKI